MLHRLQYISQGADPAEHLQNIRHVLEAGVRLVQLRLKNVTDDVYSESAGKVKQLCEKHEAKLIINDNPLVAGKCNADALHLGLNDMGVPAAKKIAGKRMIGGTANTIEHIRQRCAEGVDYIGLGPFRFTSTKEKLSPILGASGYTELIRKMREESLSTPVYAIGGIRLSDIADIMKTGVYGVAVSGLLTHAANKEELVKEINKILYHA
jgi:thiamine-phosphate pyrophosphorylase